MNNKSGSEQAVTAIKNVLMAYRCQHTHDESGDGYPLVDALSTGSTIKEGEEEIDLIVDELAVLFNEQTAHLQKLCEEQKAKLDEKAKKYLIMKGGYDYTLKQMGELKDSLATLQLALDGANHSKNLLHTQVEEQKGEIETLLKSMGVWELLKDLKAQLAKKDKEIADRADTERSMAESIIEDGVEIESLRAQLATQTAEIERLKKALGVDHTVVCADSVHHIEELEWKLATQTERARVMREALTDLKRHNNHTIEEEMWRIDKALNQDRLGDGK